MTSVIQANIQHAREASSMLIKRMEEIKAGFALVQEPWLGPEGTIRGLSRFVGHIISSPANSLPRACVVTNQKVEVLPNFISRDLVAVKFIRKDYSPLVVASAYFHHDVSSPPDEIRKLVSFCAAEGFPLVVGCDANSRHIIWGSSNTNKRGNDLFEFLCAERLVFVNEGNAPTFRNCIREEVLDLTLCSEGASKFITHWRVSTEDSLADHSHIIFDIEGAQVPQLSSYRNPRKCDWNQYRLDLQQRLLDNPRIYYNNSALEATVTHLTESIVQAYEDNCPVTTKKCKTAITWWNEDLEALRKETRRLLNRAKRTKKQLHIAEHKFMQQYFKKAIRRTKLRSWRNFCEEIESCSESSRLYKCLAKNKPAIEGPITRLDGTVTSDDAEAITELLKVHFPGCNLANHSNAPCSASRNSDNATDVKAVREIVSFNKMKTSLSRFSRFKSAGCDGIFPALLQEAFDVISGILLNVFRASLRLSYIPLGWRQVRVIFIPKPGQVDHTRAKSFRPISLSSFLLKCLERMVDWYTRERIEEQGGLNVHQHAYRKGRSVDSALASLSRSLNLALERKELALVGFLDIEGAFNNILFSAIESALARWKLPSSLVSWILAMLANRIVLARRGETEVLVQVARGCPQGGVLSPLLWCVVVDELLDLLQKAGFQVQAYADDLAIIIHGLFTMSVGERMNVALQIASRWCSGKGLSINPKKAEIVIFTRKRKCLLPEIRLDNQVLELRRCAKYLGVTFDQRLSWGQHLDNTLRKATAAFWTIRRMAGNAWGLRPAIVKQLYVSVVRPVVAYGCIAWWNKGEAISTQQRFSKLQRLACLTITSAFRTTPSAAIEVILNICPLHLFIKEQAVLAVDRVNQCGVKTYVPQGNLKDNLFELFYRYETLPRDGVTPYFDFNCDCQITFPDRETWLGEERVFTDDNAETWYTDGSVMEHRAGAGAFCSNTGEELHVSLGSMATVFQSELFAISMVLSLAIERPCCEKLIICSDSQASLKALASFVIKSRQIADCRRLIATVSRIRAVQLMWVPGHVGISGNEKADTLARRGSGLLPVGPEPFMPVPPSFFKRRVAERVSWGFSRHWETQHFVHSRDFIRFPSKAVSHQLLALSRQLLRSVICFLTGHGPFKDHLAKIGVQTPGGTLCECGVQEETARHLFCECPRFWYARGEWFGLHKATPLDIRMAPFKDIVGFVKSITK